MDWLCCEVRCEDVRRQAHFAQTFRASSEYEDTHHTHLQASLFCLRGHRLSQRSRPPQHQQTDVTTVTLFAPGSPSLALLHKEHSTCFALSHQTQGSNKLLKAGFFFFYCQSSWVKIRSTYQSVQALSREGKGSSSHRAGALLGCTGCCCPTPAPLI